jgi:tRNA(Ile)-lysidine synthase
LTGVLHRLRDRHPLILHAAYLDHGIRNDREREKELALVHRTCESMGLDLTRERLPQGLLEGLSRESGASLEEEARRFRYAFLYDAGRRKACDYIALGHTADDQVETVLMRFFQGAGLGGLPGIPRARDRLIRPLIDCSRGEIIDYLAFRGLKYVTDVTNRDIRHLRNAVRLELLPAVERVFPGFRAGVLSFSEKLAAVRDYVGSESRRAVRWTPVPEGYAVAGDQFLSAPAPLRVDSLTRLLNALAPQSRRVPYRFLSQVEDDEYVRSRRVVLRGYGVRLYWRSEQLILGTDVVGHTEKGYFIEEIEAGRVWVPEAGLLFDFGSRIRDTGRFLFRSSRTGDRINLEGGGRTVKALFAQWRVSESWRVPIVESAEGIVAVLGELFGCEDRFRAGVSYEQGKALKSMVHRYDVEVE